MILHTDLEPAVDAWITAWALSRSDVTICSSVSPVFSGKTSKKILNRLI